MKKAATLVIYDRLVRSFAMWDDVTFKWAMNKNPGCLEYIGEYFLPRKNRDYFIDHYKDPVINQPVFHGK